MLLPADVTSQSTIAKVSSMRLDSDVYRQESCQHTILLLGLELSLERLIDIKLKLDMRPQPCTSYPSAADEPDIDTCISAAAEHLARSRDGV